MLPSYNLDIFTFLVFVILHNLGCGTFTVLRTPYCGTLRGAIHNGLYRIVMYVSLWCITPIRGIYCILRHVYSALYSGLYHNTLRLLKQLACTHCTLFCNTLYSAYVALYSSLRSIILCVLSCCILHSSLRHIVLLQHRTAAWGGLYFRLWPIIHCKKRLATFPSPAGMSLPGNNLIISAQGEFGKWHPGLGRECC